MSKDSANLKFWFTHITTKYDISGLPGNSGIYDFPSMNRSIRKTDDKVKLDWDNCTIDIVGKFNDIKDCNKEKLKIVLRSNSIKKSTYMSEEEDEPKEVILRYMLGIDIESVSDVWIEDYRLSEDNYLNREGIDKDIIMQQDVVKKRIVFKLDERYWIWDWYEGEPAEETSISRLHKSLMTNINSSEKMEKGIFKIPIDQDEVDPEKLKMSKIIPIIYQPAMDSLKNYVRQLHCAKVEPNVYEISIVFNNEELRKHKIFDSVYKVIRKMIYHRTTDIETFRISSDEFSEELSKCKCLFENIYSDDYGIEFDSIHGDPPKAAFRDIKYSQFQFQSPIIFVNTSNHAMAAHDNNRDLWKWEYIPFLKNSPIHFGDLSRKQLEAEIRVME